MRKLLCGFVLLTSLCAAQYKMEPAGPPPSELAPAIASALQKDGSKIASGNGTAFCEVWFRTSAPTGSKSAEEGVSLPGIPLGALLGAIRFRAAGADRRGQNIKPGVYTLHYSLHPVNGDHLGVAPQRDFLVMVPATDDKDVNAKPGFDELVAMSRKVSGTPHPAVLSIYASPADTFPKFGKEGENDWVLNVKIGDIPVAVILVGKAEG